MIVIDATNIGLGGGTTHLKEIINSLANSGTDKKIIIYASKKNLDKLPDLDFLKKRSHYLLNKTLLHRLLFQTFYYKKLIPQNSILFSITGDFLGSYKPVVGMSRNMLLFEREHWKKMELKEKLRFYLNFRKQKICFKKASGIIFVSNYSKEIINKKFDFLKLKPQIVVHHGVSKRFHFDVKPQKPISDYNLKKPFVFNYISTIHTYKNHPAVVKAFYELRQLDLPVHINFIGAVINNSAGRRFHSALRKFDPGGSFTSYHDDIPFENVHSFYKNCDAILYASSCETMPNIVIEAMISGRPLVCSDQGPIKEFTKECAFFFNPEDSESIKNSIINFLNNPAQRWENALQAQRDALNYDWNDAAKNTMEFLSKIFEKSYGGIQDTKSLQPKVLILVRYFLPGYKSGGTLRSVVNMIEQMGNEIDFRVITSDRDFGDSKSYSNIKVDEWNPVGKAIVFYASEKNQSVRNFTKIVNETPHDLLFLNSFLDPVFTLKPLFARWMKQIPKQPTLLAPHGEFSESALGIKRWKKKPYISVTKSLGLYNDLFWQSSNESEALTIQKSMGKTAEKIMIVPDFPPVYKSSELVPQRKIRLTGEPFRICFLSRISPMKNLDFALRVLKNIEIPILFHIYGPIEDTAYWNVCQDLIKEIKPPIIVKYQGSLEYNKVSKIFSLYDLFFFPTKGENFGHVILESMLAGTPVLIADTTPWRGLKKLGVGWDLPLSFPDEFIKPILMAAEKDEKEYADWRMHVRDYAIEKCDNKDTLLANREMIKKIIHSYYIY